MKQVNIFKSAATLSNKQLRNEKKETKKAVNAALADFGQALDGALTAVIKSSDRRARNVANAAKGQFKSAVAIVAACYPYQTVDGTLAVKKTIEVTDADGVVVKRRVWSEKKLTAAAARGIVRDALKHFTDTLGKPEPLQVVIGELVDLK